MATYAIGDIQGCFAELQKLLVEIDFKKQDKLWFVGDLVNRGPKSLEVLRLVRDLGERAVVVLGNHDLHLVTQFEGFERKRKPSDCYAKLEQCLEVVGAAITKRGETALSNRGTPSDIQPTDVYDLANLVLGEVAFLHSLTNAAQPLHAFEPGGAGHRLPSHVHQLARTLEAQLTSLK